MPSRIIRITTQREALPEIHTLVASSKGSPPDRGILLGLMEERVTRPVDRGKLKKLFLLDGLIMRIIYDYADSSRFFYFTGEKDMVRELETWAQDVNLKRILEDIVKDIFIFGAGNSWVNLGYSEDSKDIPALMLINPDTGIDFIRNEKNEVICLEDGSIEGFVQKKTSFGKDEMYYRRDQITKGERILWTPKHEQDDGRDRIAHFKLFSMGDEFLGITPLQSIYKQALIKLNIEDNVGEGAFRSGGMAAYVGDPSKPSENVTDATLEEVVKELNEVSHSTILAFRRNVTLDRLPAPDLAEKAELIYLFADLISCGLGVNLSKLLEPIGSRRVAGTQELRDIDFEMRKMALFDRLAEEVREKFILRLFKARRGTTRLSEVPEIHFLTRSPALERETSRAIATLARRGQITRDPELEIFIRNRYGLPTQFVQRELDMWMEDEKKVPQVPKEVDLQQVSSS